MKWNIIIYRIIDSIKLWGRYYAISLSWLLLIIFFTYTTILAAIFLTGKSFDAEYFRCQSMIISMIVNIGLMAMVEFDLMAAGKQISHSNVFFLLVGICFAVGIYGHADIMCNKSDGQYTFPLNWNGFSFVLHLLLFIILWILKAKSLFVVADSRTCIAKKINQRSN